MSKYLLKKMQNLEYRLGSLLIGVGVPMFIQEGK